MLRIVCSLLLIALTLTAGAQVEFQAQGRASGPTVGSRQMANSIEISVHQQPIATYVFNDPDIHRPYFHSLKTPKGEPVTRNHPPIEGKDLTDHARFHPGLWMAFGDINGQDYWRNRAKVKHIRFLQPLKPGDQAASFTVLNHYLNEDQVVCEEECTIRITDDDDGVYLLWRSIFYSQNQSFYFGDQEEMGLGIRMATPLIAENEGVILNQQGGRNEEEVWGKQSPWCAYYGKNQAGETVGALLMTAPSNFRPSWFHARDYGLLTANPFGRRAFTDQSASIVTVEKGERFRLEFGVYLFQKESVNLDFFESKYRHYTSHLLKSDR